MTDQQKPASYRQTIDALVDMCKHGQGQIGAKRVTQGIWNQSATETFLPDQHAINLLLARLPDSDRAVLAGLLAHQVEVGVFETLKVLEMQHIEPFRDGYAGSPHDDFIGRLADWEWPAK